MDKSGDIFSETTEAEAEPKVGPEAQNLCAGPSLLLTHPAAVGALLALSMLLLPDLQSGD